MRPQKGRTPANSSFVFFEKLSRAFQWNVAFAVTQNLFLADYLSAYISLRRQDLLDVTVDDFEN